MTHNALPRFWLALCLAFACLASPARAQGLAPDPMAERIQRGADWLNDAMSSPVAGATRGIFAQLLPMDVANYKDFVSLAYHEKVDPELGEPALAAFFQAQARVDSKLQDVCFFLYNPRARRILDTDFILPHASKYGESLVPYAFLAAHEMGHCMEFQHFPGGPAIRQRSPLRMEVGADAFALLLLRQAGIPAEQLLEIVRSRDNRSSSHSTWPWIQSALEMRLPAASPRLIEDLWQMADKISGQAP